LPIPDDFVKHVPEKLEDGDSEDRYDLVYKVSDKRHRNTMQHFRHWYEIITHRFTIVIVILLIIGIHLSAKYVFIGTGSVVFQKISDDSWNVLTYAGTVAITHILTLFLEGLNKGDKKIWTK
jgi:desulfoferrodoxin (superoxide reductase-like protein)